MEHWSPTIVYQLAIDRHHRDLAQGDASRQLADLPQPQPLRTRLANSLITLATRLDPLNRASHQPAATASATPA